MKAHYQLWVNNFICLSNDYRIIRSLGRQIPISQQYIAVFCLCVPLLLMVGAGSAIFWILGK
jgi:hypothetical protein